MSNPERDLEAGVAEAQIRIIDSVFGYGQPAVPAALYDLDAPRLGELDLRGPAAAHLRACLIEGRALNGVPAWLHVSTPAVAAAAGLSAAAIPGFPAAVVFGIVGVIAAVVTCWRAWCERPGGTRSRVRDAARAAYVCDTDLPEVLEVRSLISQCYELQVWDDVHVTELDVRRVLQCASDVLSRCVAAELADDPGGRDRHRAAAHAPLTVVHGMVWQLKSGWMERNAPRLVAVDAAGRS